MNCADLIQQKTPIVVPHILIVDDDKAIRNLLVEYLKSQNFNAKAAANTTEARLMLSNQAFDVIILDVMMPGEGGIEWLQDLRTKHNIPVLLLTACDNLQEKINGLESGADDYITKPFEPLELVARIKSMLRRSNALNISHHPLNVGGFSFSLQTGHFSYNQNPIPLSSTERLLLQALLQRPYHPIAREDLAQKIGYRVSERTVDVQINRLRQKLKQIDPNVELIHTIRHLGYALLLESEQYDITLVK